MQHEGEGPCGDVKIEKAECINLVPEIRNNTEKEDNKWYQKKAKTGAKNEGDRR